MSQKQCSKKQHTNPKHFSKVKNILNIVPSRALHLKATLVFFVFPKQTDPTWINLSLKYTGQKCNKKTTRKSQEKYVQDMESPEASCWLKDVQQDRQTQCNRSQVYVVKTWKRWGDSLEMSQHIPEPQPMSFRQENDQSVLVYVIHSPRTGTETPAALLVNDTDK